MPSMGGDATNTGTGPNGGSMPPNADGSYPDGAYPDDGTMPHHDAAWMQLSNFAEAICCLPDMECWNPSYEGAAGRGAMMAELEHLEKEFPAKKDKFMGLNAENLKKESAEKAI